MLLWTISFYPLIDILSRIKNKNRKDEIIRKKKKKDPQISALLAWVGGINVPLQLLNS